eukprot:SAG31_NODE_528_length_14438_cov_2.252877_9_plen_340_part_00
MRLVPTVASTLRRVLERACVSDKMPSHELQALAEALRSAGISIALLGTPMLLCVFAGVLPAVACARLWDLLFLDGPGVVFATCLALLRRHARQLCDLAAASSEPDLQRLTAAWRRAADELSSDGDVDSLLVGADFDAWKPAAVHRARVAAEAQLAASHSEHHNLGEVDGGPTNKQAEDTTMLATVADSVTETAEDLRAKAAEAKAALRSVFSGSLRWGNRAAATAERATPDVTREGALVTCRDSTMSIADGQDAASQPESGTRVMSPLKGAVGAMRSRAGAVLGEYKNAAVAVWEGLDALPWAVADHYVVLQRSVIRCVSTPRVDDGGHLFLKVGGVEL